MHDATPRVLAIVVTWNKKQYVLDLLASLATLDWSHDQLDIVVVDNASEDDTVAAILADFPDVHLICNTENLGGTGGFNTGLAWAFQQTGYDYFWLLDNDVVVHRNALRALVDTLNAQPEVGVAGSAMMQLDFPWRVNEIGAFFDKQHGKLLLNRHLAEIPAWRQSTVSDLCQSDADLSQLLPDCPETHDVDYVAAASLLIRADVARQAGLWRDYFIHFDDVDWCLRIREMGHRIVACSRSLVWHVSAVAKIPTWVLYYDNRNVLDVLQTHGASKAVLQRLQRYILKKAVYYHLIGKADLAALHHDAIRDFRQHRLGKKAIQLTASYQPFDTLPEITRGKKVLLPQALDAALTDKLQPLLSTAQVTSYQQSGWRHWLRLVGRFDYVIQSDYRPNIMLTWLGAEMIYVNQDAICLRPRPRLTSVLWAAFRYFSGKV